MTITPSLAGYVRNQIEQRERQMQTSFPAKVIGYHSATGTVTVEPQFLEVWRENDARRAEDIDAPEDAYVEDVPILFPHGGGLQITFPVDPGDFGLVTCTKYSLDVWREAATMGDPGDLRRFTMSGAVFHPVNLYPTSGYIKHDGGDYISLSAGGTVDFVALKSDVDDIKTMLDDVQSKYNTHTHLGEYLSPGDVTTVTPLPQSTTSYTVQASSKVKVE